MSSRLKERSKQFNEKEHIDENLISEAIALDNLIAKKIIEDYNKKSSENNLLINTYLNVYIKEEFNKDNYTFFSNPVMKLGPEYLSKYISIDNLKIINEIQIKLKNKSKKTYEKITKNEPVTQKELDELCVYFYNALPSDEAALKRADEVLTYVLQNPENITLKQKYFILKTALTLKTHKFNSNEKIKEKMNVELVIADKSLEKGGSSNGGKIFINRAHLKNCSFINNTYHPKNNWTEKHKEGYEILSDLFHEFRHEEQNYCLRNNINNNMSCYQAIYEIFLKYYNSEEEYNRNYGCYEIENDANLHGGIYLRDFINNRELSCNKDIINNHIHTRNLLYIYGFSLSGKKNDNNLPTIITYKYNTANIQNILKQKPEFLKEFPILLDYYNLDGSYKKIDEIIFNKDNAFFYDNMLYHIEKGELDSFDISKFDTNQKKEIIKSLYSLVSYNTKKVKDLYNYCKIKKETLDETVNPKQIFIQLSDTLKNQKKINSYITNLINKYGNNIDSLSKYWLIGENRINDDMKETVKYTMKFKNLWPSIFSQLDLSNVYYNDYKEMFKEDNNKYKR